MATKKEESRTGALTVHGTGEVRVRPDTATISLGVTTRGRTAQEAANLNAERIASVIQAIQQLGIPKDDIQTTALFVYPIISYEEGPTYGQIIGYGAENTITVRTDVELAGRVFDAGIAAGANQSSSIAFSLKNERPARDRALELAIRSAEHEARLAATTAGVRLAGPRSIEIGRSPDRIFLSRTAEAAAPTPTPILPGLITIIAQVTMVFDYLY